MVEQRVLAVDDDPAALEAIVALLRQDGYEVHAAGSAEDAEVLLQRLPFLLIVTDLVLPEKSGIDLVRYAQAVSPETHSIVVTGHGTLQTAVEALRAGAIDYLTKPIDPQQLRALIDRFVSPRPEHLAPVAEPSEGSWDPKGMTSASAAMGAVFEKIRLAAGTDGTVLIRGESGTGKERCALTIHEQSSRSRGPFVSFHAGEVPQEKVFTELFGDDRVGEGRRGRLEEAQGGTLYIEEIDALDEDAQRALAAHLDVPRDSDLGATLDPRVIASTHRDLLAQVNAGRFREDLYYRLNIFPIEVPPLRHRKEDIPLLTDSFLRSFATKYEKTLPSIPPETRALLLGYGWPGNVRELRNVIEHAVILCPDDILRPELLPRMLHSERSSDLSILIPVGMKMKEIEKTVIARTLDAYRWNKNRTAKILGISRRSLYNKLDRYQITRETGSAHSQVSPTTLPLPLAEGDG